MWQEPYHENVVKNCIRRPKLRQRFLEMLLGQLKGAESRKLDHPLRGLLDGGYGLRNILEIDPKFTKTSVNSYTLHAIVDEIQFVSPPNRHENNLDSVVYLCLEITLAPLIESGVVASLRRGYHNFFIAYDADAIASGLEEVDNYYFQPKSLLKHICSQKRAPLEHSDETRIITNILREMTEQE